MFLFLIIGLVMGFAAFVCLLGVFFNLAASEKKPDDDSASQRE